ncbi:hypothetical protein STENM327S_02336 [Streptomyces tendae]
MKHLFGVAGRCAGPGVRKILPARYPYVVALRPGMRRDFEWDRPGASHAPPTYKEASTVPHVLVLNASYKPLGVVPLRRALVLVLENKAICLEESGAFLHSATQAVPAPSVVRLKRFIPASPTGVRSP